MILLIHLLLSVAHAAITTAIKAFSSVAGETITDGGQLVKTLTFEAGLGTITNVKLDLFMTHPNAIDMILYLQTPSNNWYCVFYMVGGTSDNFGVSAEDTCVITTLNPSYSINSFDGPGVAYNYGF